MRALLFLIAILGTCDIPLNAQDLFEARQLTKEAGREGFATWSPDGKQIMYQFTEKGNRDGKNGLWLINADGRGAVQIMEGVAEHAKWSPDGQWVVYDADTGQNIKMIPATGGEVREFLPDSIGIFRGGLPCWSPDSKQIAFIEGSTGSLFVLHLESGRLTSLYCEEGMLPMPGGWTPDGSYVMVALMDRQTRKSTMWKFAVDGQEKIRITGHHENFYRHITLSPDGLWLVYAALVDRHLGLYIMPAEGGSSIPLAISPGAHNEGPNWSPDGKSIAFNSTRGQNADIWIMDLDLDLIQRMIR
ncbi:MAG: hypothetical protein ABFS28_05895 [Bacteroidota bacterium]